MRATFRNKIRVLFTNWVFWLGVVTGVAILIRSFPAYTNAAWGCDFGIYYGLTNSFVKTKNLINPYDGWGNSYQYFPMLYTITGIGHWITGIDIFSLLPKIAPVFGGLTIPILYFITVKLFKDRFVALLSSTLLSVATFHVYQTSHAAPLTFGHFFMMLSIYFFMRYIKEKRYLVPLIMTTCFLVLSHHFTTYFYLISVTAIFLIDTFSGETLNHANKHLLIYISAASALTFSYWAFVAKPVFYIFMNHRMFLQQYQLILLYYFLLFGGYFIVRYMRKQEFSFDFLNHLPSLSLWKKTGYFFIFLLFILILASIFGVPGVYVKITPLALIYSLPMIFLVSLSFTGLSFLRKMDNGHLIIGWVVAIFTSFLCSLVSSSLFPDRHLEYLIVPLCIAAAFTLKRLLGEVNGVHLRQMMVHPFRYRYPSLNVHRNRVLLIIAIGTMCVANMMAAYPTVEVLNAIDERVTQPCVNAIEWMKGNVTPSVTASDHRLSMLLWAEGFNITYDLTNFTWTAENVSDCILELTELNITYIVIDDIMRNSIVYVGVGKYYHMTNESYEKFMNDPFELIYRNATVNLDGEEEHWVEVYRVNKSQLQY